MVNCPAPRLASNNLKALNGQLSQLSLFICKRLDRRMKVKPRAGSHLLRRPHPGIALNKHFAGNGEIIYKHACALGCEGIVSKRLGSPYLSGRADYWVKIKNPIAPAVRREAEKEWGR